MSFYASRRVTSSSTGRLAVEVGFRAPLHEPVQVGSRFVLAVALAVTFPATQREALRVELQIPLRILCGLATVVARKTYPETPFRDAQGAPVQTAPRTVPGTVPTAVRHATAYAWLVTCNILLDNELAGWAFTQVHENGRNPASDASCAEKRPKSVPPEPNGTLGVRDSGRPILAKKAQVLMDRWQNRGLSPDGPLRHPHQVLIVPAPMP